VHELSLSVIEHLVVVPAAGGTVQDFTLSEPMHQLIAVDDTNAYAWLDVDYKILRINLANGAVTNMASVVNLEGPQFANDAIYYTTQSSLGSNADRTVFSVGKSSTTPASASGLLCTGPFLAVSDGVLCVGNFVSGAAGNAKTHVIAKTDPRGAHAVSFADTTAIPGTPQPFAEAGGSIYVDFAGAGTHSEIVKLSATAEATPIACQRTATQQTEAHRAEAVVGDTSVFWIEGTNIFSAPR